MSNGERRSWLRRLLPWELRQQAEERARATGRTAGEVLHAWASNGYISREKRREAEAEEL